jgi:hypothetical protein
VHSCEEGAHLVEVVLPSWERLTHMCEDFSRVVEGAIMSKGTHF